jgi:drug/metabolite transporter (DMT)-like permease
MKSHPPAIDAPLAAAPALHTGILLMVGGGLLLGTLGVFLHEAQVHPLTAVLFRCAFGAAALLAYAAATGRLAELRLRSRSGWAVAAATALLVVLNWVFFFTAIQYTSIAVATIAFHVQPLWVMAAGVLLFGEKASTRRLVAALAALAGLALATGLAGRPQAFDPSFILGLLFAVLGSLSYAVVTLIAQRQRQATGFSLAFWQCALGALAVCWWPLVDGLPQGLSTWGWLAGIGVIHSAAAYVLLYEGMRRLQAGQVAILQFVYPGAAIVVDLVVYQRALSPSAWFGWALMVGAILSMREPARRQRKRAGQAVTRRRSGSRHRGTALRVRRPGGGRSHRPRRPARRPGEPPRA